MTNSVPKKRPLGLKKASEKKIKLDNGAENQTPDTPTINDHNDDQTATVALRAREGKEADDFDGLEDIYENAIETLLSDQDQALLLFQGAIHECDRLLKLSDLEGSNISLPTKYYYIYGMSLYNLSEISEPEDAVEYLKLAKERLLQAKYSVTSNTESTINLSPKISSLWSINFSLGKVYLSLAQILETKKSNKAFDDGLQCLDASVKYLQEYSKAEPKGVELNEEDKANPSSEVLSIVDLVLSFAECTSEFKTLIKAITWAKNASNVLKKDNSPSDINYFDAKAEWIMANYYLEDIENELDSNSEDGDKQENEPSISEAKAKTLEYLISAKDLLLSVIEDANSGKQIESLNLLGEVMLNIGNLETDEEIQEGCYRKSLGYYKKSQKISGDKDNIPEELLEFLSQYE